MSRTVVSALSRVVAHRSTRRGLLARSAFGATALAVAPLVFAMRPISAHAAICSCAGSRCNCHSDCCDGYTDFCCKLTGENVCPPNTMVAGWWQAHGTGHCDVDGSRRPRYYLDCNHVCADGCGCGSSGVCRSSCTPAKCRCFAGCNSRRVDCVRFRYGQCNQDIDCVGPIACRVVTCVPPWLWDESCVNSRATDNYTGRHDSPCLHNGFTDLPPNATYVEPVLWAVKEGIANGYSSDIFGPLEAVLRWHMAVFLWRYQGQPMARTRPSFSDVNNPAYFDAVAWLVENDITSGFDGGLFRPDDELSRGQAVTFLWRLEGRPSPSFDIQYPFDDVSDGSHYRLAAQWSRWAEITNGIDERTFGGERSVSRAEAVTLLFRYDQYRKAERSRPKRHWR